MKNLTMTQHIEITQLISAMREQTLDECEAIAERYIIEAKNREYRDLVLQAEAIADAIAALKSKGERDAK